MTTKTPSSNAQYLTHLSHVRILRQHGSHLAPRDELGASLAGRVLIFLEALEVCVSALLISQSEMATLLRPFDLS